MINKYMNMDPIPWLTDGVNPAVSYLVKNDILKLRDSEENYDELLKSELTDYFKENYNKHVLGDFTHYNLFYKGSVWFFLLAIESGYKCSSDFIFSTADKLCTAIQLENGGFKFSYKSSDAVGCRSGSMTYALLKSGISDSRSINGINWIIKHQRKDGGWLHCPVAGFYDVIKLVFSNKTGNGLKHEDNENISSCPVASYSCLKALVQSNNNLYNASVRRAVDFFIENNFFIDSGKKLLCGNSIEFCKLGYPIMSQYDYLSGLNLVLETKSNKETGHGELFNNIIKKQNRDGSWNCENRLNGMIKEKSLKSRWTTFNALKLINISQ